MSKFPVESTDGEGIIEAVNYLLSGPVSSGQNFQGSSQFALGYLTGNYRPPFTSKTVIKEATGTSGNNTIDVSPDNSGIVLGMYVTGIDIPAFTTVTGIGQTIDNVATITLSANITNDIDFLVYFTPSIIPALYIAPISLASSEMLDEFTWKFSFTAPQLAPPFTLGNPITVSGVTDPTYDGTYSPIGVVECTNTYVIARTQSAYTVVAPSGGGTVEYYSTAVTPAVVNSNYYLSTDCNAKVTVTGGTDRVFLSGQISNTIYYDATLTSQLNYLVAINRYKGVINDDPTNPEYKFNLDGTVAVKLLFKTGLTSGTTVFIPTIETIFTSVVDNPGPGYYWYIIDLLYYTASGDLQVAYSELDLRSLTAQVVKQ